MPSAAPPSQPRSLLVAIANGRYRSLGELPDAGSDAEALAQVLREQHGFETEVLHDLARGELLDRMDALLGEGSLAKGRLLVYWIGHGKEAADGSLRLMVPGTAGDVEVGQAGLLAEWAARSGARQILLVLDTCYAGRGLVEAMRLAFSEIGGRAAPAHAWFGAVAASLGDERSRGGALVGAFRRLLTHGPSPAQGRAPDIRWSPKHPFIRGDDLLHTLVEEWKCSPHADSHAVLPMTFGEAWDLVRNPLHEVGLAERTVEHLLQAARGGGGEVSHFTGRQQPLRRIVNWLRLGQPGLMLVSGPAGCGKSALVGRIVSLSLPRERERLEHDGPIPAELDPGLGCVHAQLQLHGATVDSAAERLARNLNCDPAQALYGVLAVAHQRRREGAPLVVVVDGLDEAGSYARDVALELLKPLAREALVLVATREVQWEDAALTDLLVPPGERIDLDADAEESLEDLQTYIHRRLQGVDPRMNADLVAAELLRPRDHRDRASFLLARLVTSQLREQPLDTGAADWQTQLASTAENALERDLLAAAVEIDGQASAHAARELMRALACSLGAGFPADDVWPAVATALSQHGTVYRREHVYALLSGMGRHIVISVDDGQVVYRLAHRQLAEYLLDAGTSAERVALAGAVAGLYRAWLDGAHRAQDHAYLWNFTWRHLAEAGEQGLALLEDLAASHRSEFVLDLALAYGFAGAEAFLSGQARQAADHLRRATVLRRELGDTRRLVSQLMQLSVAASWSGDDEGAQVAADEAMEAARAMRGDPQSRAVVANAMQARAYAQLRQGQWALAHRFARELLEFLEDRDDPAEDWSTQVEAHGLVSQAAGVLGDLDESLQHAEKALALCDEHRDPDGDTLVFLQACSMLVHARSLAALRTLSSGESVSEPLDLGPGLRLLEHHRRGGSLGSAAHTIIAKGLLALVRLILINRALGQSIADEPDEQGLLGDVQVVLRPHVAQMADAAALYGTACMMRASWMAAKLGEPRSALPLLREAESVMRPWAERSSLLAISLAECLHTMTQFEWPSLVDGSCADPGAVMQRQKEATLLMRRYAPPTMLRVRAEALGRLSDLQAMFASEEAIVTRAEAIEVMRELIPAEPALRWTCAANLANQAGYILDSRAGEAAAMAREALALLESMRSTPEVEFVRALAQINLGAAEILLRGADLVHGAPAMAKGALQSALTALDALEPNANVWSAKGNAHLNLAQVALFEGDPDAALVHGLASVQAFQSPGLLALQSANVMLAQVLVGQAECATGDMEGGLSRLREVMAHARRQCEGAPDPAPMELQKLALGVYRAAPELWPEMLEALKTRPQLVARLYWLRPRRLAELPILVRELREALECQPPEHWRELRQIARHHRSAAAGAFDEAWRVEAGDIPSWLVLDVSLESPVIGWWNTSNWRQSQDFLLDHPELLQAGPAIDLLLEELAFGSDDRRLVDRHLTLLAQAREQGIEAAYAPMMLDFEVERWLSSPDPKHHFERHPELRRSEVVQWLRTEGRGREDALAFLAILELVQRGEGELAFGLLTAADPRMEWLEAAWRSRDAGRLSALARLMYFAAEGASRRRAAVAWAIAAAIAPETPAIDLAVALQGLAADEAPELTRQVTDALAHHAPAAAPLAAMVSVIHLAAPVQA